MVIFQKRKNTRSGRDERYEKEEDISKRKKITKEDKVQPNHESGQKVTIVIHETVTE